MRNYKPRHIYSFLLVLSLSVFGDIARGYAQCDPLTTLFASGNNQDGIMFDVQAIIDITVTGFPINCQDPGMPYEMEIYFRTGTHVGFENSAVGWTLIGDNVGAPFIGGATDTPTPVPILLNQPILAGQTGAFYVTETGTGGNLAYTDGVLTGALSVTDGNVNIYEGTGKEYPFAQNFNPRVPNFTLEYDCCPAPLLGSIPEACLGAGDGSIIAEGQGLGPWSYTITDINGFVWDTINVNGPVTFNAAGSGLYTVAATDANGCDAQDIILVTADLNVSIGVTVSDNVCFGGMLGAAEAEVTGGTGPFDFTWTDAFATTIQIDPGTFGIAAIDSLGSTAFNVFVTDANGCIGATSFNVSQPVVPLTLTTSVTDVLCNAAFDGTLDAESDGQAPFTYTLHDVFGNLIDSVPNSIAAPYTFAAVPAGDFFVTVIDADGCELNGIETLIEPTAIQVQSSMIPMLCHDEAAGIANIDNIAGGMLPYDVVSWNDPAAQTGNSAIDLLPGMYIATITDANGCVFEEQYDFVNPPELVLTPRYQTDTCNQGVGTAIVFPNQGTPPYTFRWIMDDLDTPDHPDLFAGFYDVEVTDFNGCVGVNSIEVKDSLTYPIAEFDLRFNLDEDQLSQQVLFEDLSYDVIQWEWNFGNGESSFEKHPAYNYREAGDYLVQLIVYNGFCYDTAWDYVNIDPLLTVYIPNAFTPGRNGFNDVFGPRGEGIEQESWDMFIFNRWGEMVWQTGSYDKFWDGTNWFTDAAVPVGTYVYHIKFREFADLDRHEYTGWVNVIRD
ncbi:MAG: gliding motility-associated-like protein [Bacteroidia bacterium]|jgi:gliding motility-associated-like protein